MAKTLRYTELSEEAKIFMTKWFGPQAMFGLFTIAKDGDILFTHYNMDGCIPLSTRRSPYVDRS